MDRSQRDKRLGCTGALQVYASTALFLFDTAGFLGGWLEDVTVEQLLEECGIPSIDVPHVLQHVPFRSPMAVTT
jgi:alpha-L-rhamnosidase